MAELPTPAILAKRVADALQMMFDGPVTQSEFYRVHLPKLSEGRVVTVPLIGHPNYLITMRANQPGGVNLAGAMFGCAKKLTTEAMIDDALCELANMVAGQVKSLMAREHQVGVPGLLENEETLDGANPLVGARMNIGDATAEIDVAVAEYRPPVIKEGPPSDPKGPTVAIAEDDEITLSFVKAAVQSAGMCVVSETRDGRAALEDIRRCRPDAICLDINMPEMNGLEVLAELRKESPDAIVFLISSFATAENVREAIRLRANGIIVKPFVKARIISEIERAVAIRDRRRAEAATPQALAAQ